LFNCNVKYAWSLPSRNCVFFLICFQQLSATVYYSRNATGGAWSSTASWTLSSSGVGASAPTIPQRTDSVVILNGHTIQISSISDNGSAGVSPDDLNRANVGGFNGDGTDAFYHTGYIWIQSGGTLTSTKRLMFEGKTVVSTGGTLKTTSNDDFVNLGNLQVEAGSFVDISDDIIFSGNSTSYINNTSFSTDDIYLDHTDALVCGDSIAIDDAIQEFNGSDANVQFCSTLTVSCTDGNCCNSRPPSPCSTPFSGGGNFTLPVDLLFLNSVIVNKEVVISWSTASELNNDYFLIEKKTTGLWQVLGQVYGAGTSNEVQDYKFVDVDLPVSSSYYRLKQTDFDGKNTYSDITTVKNSEIENVEIKYVFRNRSLQVFCPVNQSVAIKIIGLYGEEIVSFENVKNEQEIDFIDLQSSWYILQFVSGSYHSIEKVYLTDF